MIELHPLPACWQLVCDGCAAYRAPVAEISQARNDARERGWRCGVDEPGDGPLRDYCPVCAAKQHAEGDDSEWIAS